MIHPRILSLALAIAVFTGAAFARQSVADQFSEYTASGAHLAWYGYVHSAETERIATENDFSSEAVTTARVHAYYSFYYGYYGYEYQFADWVSYAGDLAESSKEHGWGIFEYTYYQILPEYPYPQVDAVVYNSYTGGTYMFYAQAYFDAAIASLGQ